MWKNIFALTGCCQDVWYSRGTPDEWIFCWSGYFLLNDSSLYVHHSTSYDHRMLSNEVRLLKKPSILFSILLFFLSSFPPSLPSNTLYLIFFVVPTFLCSFVRSFVRSIIPSSLSLFVPSFILFFLCLLLRSFFSFFVPSSFYSFFRSFVRSFARLFVLSILPCFLVSFHYTFITFSLFQMNVGEVFISCSDSQLDSDVPKSSRCELEVDVISTDILNQLEIGSKVVFLWCEYFTLSKSESSLSLFLA